MSSPIPISFFNNVHPNKSSKEISNNVKPKQNAYATKISSTECKHLPNQFSKLPASLTRTN